MEGIGQERRAERGLGAASSFGDAVVTTEERTHMRAHWIASASACMGQSG